LVVVVISRTRVYKAFLRACADYTLNTTSGFRDICSIFDNFSTLTKRAMSSLLIDCSSRCS